MKKVTSTMVAREAGVAQSTVSLVMNNRPNASPEAYRKVIAAAEKLGYPLTPQNKRLNIGLFLSYEKAIMSFRTMFITALKDEIHKRRYQLNIMCIEDIGLFNERTLSGAIDLTNEPRLHALWREHCTTAVVRFNNRSDHANNIATIYPDIKHDMALMLDCFFNHGHRRIGLMLSAPLYMEEGLYARNDVAFVKEMRRRNCPNPEDYVSYDNSTPNIENLKRLLKLGVTALICVPGETFLWVYHELQKLNLKVPDDISIISFEYNEALQYWNPPITVMTRDYYSFSVMALDMLEKMLNNQTVQDSCLPGKLIERESIKDLR